VEREGRKLKYEGEREGGIEGGRMEGGCEERIYSIRVNFKIDLSISSNPTWRQITYLTFKGRDTVLDVSMYNTESRY